MHETMEGIDNQTQTIVTDIISEFTCYCQGFQRNNEIISQCNELASVYDKRQNDDTLKDLLHFTDPINQKDDTHGWHLERIATSELEKKRGNTTNDPVKIFKTDCKYSSSVIIKILEEGKKHDNHRRTIKASMKAQRQALLLEVKSTKEAVDQVHRYVELPKSSNLVESNSN